MCRTVSSHDRVLCKVSDIVGLVPRGWRDNAVIPQNRTTGLERPGSMLLAACSVFRAQFRYSRDVGGFLIGITSPAIEPGYPRRWMKRIKARERQNRGTGLGVTRPGDEPARPGARRLITRIDWTTAGDAVRGGRARLRGPPGACVA